MKLQRAPANPNWKLTKTNLMRKLLQALPAFNPFDYIQLPRDIHEMSSNCVHP